MKGKIYRSEIKIVVLSDEPLNLDSMNLADLGYAIDEGGCSGNVVVIKNNVEHRGKSAVKQIKSIGTDTEFFGISIFGDKIDD